MNMTPDSPEGLVGVAGAIIAMAFTLSKIVNAWKGDSAQGAGHDAMKQTVEGLSTEIARLSKQNEELAFKANDYQLKILALNERLIEVKSQLAMTPTNCVKCGHPI